MDDENRIRYIDMARGVAILFMLFTHTMSSNNLVKTWTFAWHMPIFFVISGILYTMKKENKPFRKWGRSVIRLMIPYCIWGGVLIGWYALIGVISGDYSSMSSRLISLLTLRGVDSMWFIPCFLIGELLFILLIYVSDKLCLISALVAVIIIVILNDFSSLGWLQVLVRSVIAFTFFAFGYLLQKFCLLRNINWVIAFSLFLIGSILSVVNGFSALGDLSLNQPILYFLSAWLLSTAILAICHLISEKGLKLKLLSVFGENSIVILCTNNLLIEIIRLLDYKITGNVLIAWGIWGNMLFTIILLILEYAIICFEKHFCPWTFGSIKRKTTV